MYNIPIIQTKHSYTKNLQILLQDSEKLATRIATSCDKFSKSFHLLFDMRIHLLKRNTPLLKNAPKKSFRSFSLPANALFIGFSADRLMRWDPSTAQFFLSAVVNKCIKVNPNTDREPNNTASLTLPRWKIFSGWRIYRAYPSAEKPMNRAFAERLKLLKEK